MKYALLGITALAALIAVFVLGYRWDAAINRGHTWSFGHMKRLLIIGLCVLLVAPVLVLVALKWGIRGERRTVERAVEATMLNIRGLEAQKTFSAEAAKAAVVAPARLELFGTNPVRFRVDAHTSWPDWIIYEYDSRTPERGVYHYLF